MPYYPTIEEDLARAKQILRAGKMDATELRGKFPDDMIDKIIEGSGTIYGQDRYAAYKLLESFVAEIEKLHEMLKRPA